MDVPTNKINYIRKFEFKEFKNIKDLEIGKPYKIES